MNATMFLLTAKLDRFGVPYVQLNDYSIIIAPLTSPWYEILPCTKEIYLDGQNYLYLDINEPNIYLDKFIKRSDEQTMQLLAED